METKRKSFQGVLNIVRFNWHFYVLTAIVLLVLMIFQNQLYEGLRPIAFWATALASISITLSLLTSYYIYDVSNLYKTPWLSDCTGDKILTVNAGFDETTEILRSQLPTCKFTAIDFYDAEKHTEISIERARKAYPQSLSVVKTSTAKLPFADNTFDKALATLSAHEIRDDTERITFFAELKRVTKSGGHIYVTEHLRDINNFIAYTLGAFHFHSKTTWQRTFKEAQLHVKKEVKTTPFITTFILQ